MKGITSSIILIPILPLLGMLSSFNQEDPSANRMKIFDLKGQRVKVTHHVEARFYGRYEGEKEGYLLLNRDGTGEYLYDIQIPSKDCGTGVIKIEWGFLLDEQDQVVRFERDYGFSYPVILKCTGLVCFQGCRVNYIVDYILDKNQGRLEVSSSDDWEKGF